MDSVKHKVILITGASSGIGAETAQLFAKYGAKLVIGGRNEANLQRTAKLCQNHGLKSEDIVCVTGDITDEDVCNKLVDTTIQHFGRLDVLVNNAGAGFIGSIETLTPENLDFLYNVLLRSVFMITKRAVPHLKQVKGCIVNVSSAASTLYQIEFMGYGMMKAALDHFTTTLAQELGPSGVRVNCIRPGAIATGIGARAAENSGRTPSDDDKQAWINAHALKRIGQVEEVAQLVVFLSSDAASFMTGSNVLVDGGLSSTSPV